MMTEPSFTKSSRYPFFLVTAVACAIAILVLIDRYGSVGVFRIAAWVVFFPYSILVKVLQRSPLDIDHQVLFELMVGFPLLIGYWYGAWKLILKRLSG